MSEIKIPCNRCQLNFNKRDRSPLFEDLKLCPRCRRKEEVNQTGFEGLSDLVIELTTEAQKAYQPYCPCPFQPGTVEKIAWMRKRAENHEPLFNKYDEKR